MDFTSVRTMCIIPLSYSQLLTALLATRLPQRGKAFDDLRLCAEKDGLQHAFQLHLRAYDVHEAIIV